jgi:hypothetical protein
MNSRETNMKNERQKKRERDKSNKSQVKICEEES